ncbi:HAMP domain-containing sensor histidine kinase [Anaeromyxobacter sp. SG64]|uniref:sensor histidine kinase n=1 Tax=Anaeromyxobacter sp. SG64 TaxID=2925409 RepID=UPI001F5645E0|nr:HAMP domain-containing sensor histidine kinase [Anaeromyxobacter sp. SG64]
MAEHVTQPAPGEGEASERSRARLADGLERLLAVEPEERALRRLLSALADAVPAIDSVALVVREGDRLEVLAQVGFDDGAPAEVEGGLAAEVVAAGTPRTAPRPGAPFPPGTRHGAGTPLVGCAVAGALLAGTRGDAPLDAEALLLLRAAADRAARALDRDRLGRAHEDARETLRRAEADLETRRRTVDFILGVVGHDLRNPLGAIHMSASLLHTKGGLAGWQARAIERTRSSAGRMGRIIQDLLSYTRTRLGNGIPVSPRPASLDAVARKVVDELRAVNSDRTVEIAIHGDAAGEWDPDRLEQVVSNLVSNAIDHGDPAVPVRVEVDGDEPDRVLLHVRNGGPGIPPEVLTHLFEPFSRGPEEKSRKASGLGLGLYISREIVRGHGGDIAARSVEGETTVTVHLPRRCAARPS